MNFFENLLGALQVGETLIFSPVLRGWYNRWGATDAEIERVLPGDDLLPESLLGYTRAITIHAPAERVLPEYQELQIGDLIRLGSQGYPCFAVTSQEARYPLVLVSADPKTGQAVEYRDQMEKSFSMATWQFFLEPLNPGATRLLVRQRLAYSPDMKWGWRLTEPVAFVMGRKMMLGIRERAEQDNT
jgi:hypothetical protein